MEEMKQNHEQNEKSIPILKILYKNLLLIILTTVLFALIALGYNIAKVPPTYTASRSLILRMQITDDNFANSQLANEAELSKIYFKSVETIIKSGKLNEEINAKYKEIRTDDTQVINRGAIGMKYGEHSLIFKMQYTDKSPEFAKEKLDAIIKVIQQTDMFDGTTPADDVKFIPTQTDSTVTPNSSKLKYTLFGALIGLVLSVGVSFLIYLLDNTVKDKKEFEEMTGVSVIAYINKDNEKKQQKKRRK